jgi:DNA excision repair protein ERCC-3
LPCGAGKTAVGVAASMAVASTTLILVPSRAVGAQWQDAFASFTTRPPSEVAGVGAARLAPVTIATYHAATGGRLAGALIERQWDLVIYDEVQSLPADVFRLAAAFQSSRRLGLTATLVREDGRERDIAALVGPPLYDVSWIELERLGWISPARCVEVRLPATTSSIDRFRFKMAALQRLLALHADQHIIVAGTAVSALRRAGERLSFPVLTGESVHEERANVLDQFRDGTIPVVGLSRIGSVGLDMPNASVLIQISGTFGSRQEEAQRLGRLLRPKPEKTATFYSLVSGGTREEEYAARRQRFLVNQGYRYEMMDAQDLPRAGGLANLTG